MLSMLTAIEQNVEVANATDLLHVHLANTKCPSPVNAPDVHVRRIRSIQFFRLHL